MKRMLAAAVVALVVVATASAKAPPSGFRVCGATTCADIAQNDAERLAINIFYTATTALDAAPAPAPFYAIHWQWPNKPEETGYYIPSAKAVYLHADPGTRMSAGWYVLTGDACSTLENVTQDVAAFAAPAVTRVTVAGSEASDPASYVRLWSVGKRVFDFPTSKLLRVRIFTDPKSAWHGSLLVARRGNLMLRDGTVFAIPRQLAARIRARASLG